MCLPSNHAALGQDDHLKILFLLKLIGMKVKVFKLTGTLVFHIKDMMQGALVKVEDAKYVERRSDILYLISSFFLMDKRQNGAKNVLNISVVAKQKEVGAFFFL